MKAETRVPINEVAIYDAKPNKMFPDWMTVRMRFLRFRFPVPRAACGKKSKKHWTMLLQFKAVDFEHSFVVAKSFPESFPPLTPVCEDHPLEPLFLSSVKHQHRKVKR